MINWNADERDGFQKAANYMQKYSAFTVCINTAQLLRERALRCCRLRGHFTKKSYSIVSEMAFRGTNKTAGNGDEIVESFFQQNHQN
jgi:hypothetical protein